MNEIGTPDQIRLDPFKNLKTKGYPLWRLYNLRILYIKIRYI